MSEDDNSGMGRSTSRKEGGRKIDRANPTQMFNNNNNNNHNASIYTPCLVKYVVLCTHISSTASHFSGPDKIIHIKIGETRYIMRDFVIFLGLWALLISH